MQTAETLACQNSGPDHSCKNENL